VAVAGRAASVVTTTVVSACSISSVRAASSDEYRTAASRWSGLTMMRRTFRRCQSAWYGTSTIEGRDVEVWHVSQDGLDWRRHRPRYQRVVSSSALPQSSASFRLGFQHGDESFGELKAIAEAGISVWFYAKHEAFTHGTLQSTVMGVLEGEVSAEERRKASTRTHEALLKKWEAGHVVGGLIFGYRHEDIMTGHKDSSGRPLRSHVERRVYEPEAAVILCCFATAWVKASDSAALCLV
jgi:hypothetical protein